MTEGEILADLRRQCGKWADADAIQEAVTRAIELDPAIRGTTLRDAALNILRRIGREHQDARRRGGAVANRASPGAARVQPTPVRRKQSKKHRQPRGVVKSHAFDTGLHITPTCSGVIPDDTLRFACTQIAAELRLGAFGEPLPGRVAPLLQEMHQELYGVAPEHHWVYVLVDEIGFAQLQALRRLEIDAHPHVPHESSATLTPTGRRTAESKPLRLPVKTMMVQSAPGRVMRAVYQEVGEEYVLRAVETFGRREVPMTYSTDDVERARQILTVARLRLTSLTWPQALPSYADEPVLVAWLYQRAGFGGRGGQEKVKSATLCAWLSDPYVLAQQIERYAHRRAQRCTDAEAAVLETGLAALAGLVRERAGVGPDGTTGRPVSDPIAVPRTSQ